MNPIRLSYSSLETLNVCERKFQIEKLLVNDFQKEESAHTLFGKAFGAGVQSYFQHQDQDKALFDCWINYYPEEEIEGKKTVMRSLIALQKCFPSLDNLLMEYELVSFEGKPAVELSFRLDIDEEYYFVGYVDLVLRHRFTGQYVVLDIKTTGLNLLDLSPLYKNSGQALGYSITLDQIVGHELSEYGVIYLVAQLGKTLADCKLHTYPFDKSLLDRLNWFITLGLDVERLKRMHQLNSFPMRGSSCLQYMRPCRHFGTCNLKVFDRPKEPEEDLIDYQFIYQLDDVIEDHLRRINNVS